MDKSVLIILLINIVIVFSIVLVSTKVVLVKMKNNRVNKFKQYTYDIK